MDPASLAAALVAAQMANMQMAVAARMDAQQGQSVANLLASAEQNMNRVANLAPGVGTKVDITA